MKRKGGKRVAEGNKTKVSSHSGGGGGSEEGRNSI